MKNRERFNGSFGADLCRKAMTDALNKFEAGFDRFTKKFPHVSKNYVYHPEENDLWTASFYPGIAYLAYDITGDESYLAHAGEYLDSFEERLELKRSINHDLGFLYTLSCVAYYKLTGDRRAGDIARRASDLLMERYNERGRYIQAWGRMGLKYPEVKIIIDTMMNLPLLYWTGDERKREAARRHAVTSARYLIREDFSSFHTCLMNPDTGEAVAGKTHQGHADGSTWARGQAWAVYGFTLSYLYTEDEAFLIVAKKTAEYFIDNLPGNFVPYWDFTFTDENPDLRDTSAASVFVCGLLELSKYVEQEEAKFYGQVARSIMESLYKSCSTAGNPGADGFLLEGVYHRSNGANECTIWGDYFYFEALVRLLKDWKPYW